MGETVENKRRAVIFGGGQVVNYSAIESLLFEDDFIICADSGYSHCLELGVTPHLLVGDFDSIGKIPEGIEKVTLPKDKNYSDMVFAVEGAIRMNFSTILLIGALGGRFDHSLANIQTLAYLTQRGINSFITDGSVQIFCLHTENKPKGIVLSPVNGYYFSLLAHSAMCKSVTINGAKYPLNHHDLTNTLPRAISNEFAGSDVSITMDDGTLLIMLVPLN